MNNKTTRRLIASAALAIAAISGVASAPSAAAAGDPSCSVSTHVSGNTYTATVKSHCWVQVRALWQPAGGSAQYWSEWTPAYQSSSASVTTTPNLVRGENNYDSAWR